MPHTPTPWVGLAALLAMFLLPYLSERLFQGPRTIRHPRRHLCDDCHPPGPTSTPAHPQSAGPFRPFAGSCAGSTRRPGWNAAQGADLTVGARLIRNARLPAHATRAHHLARTRLVSR